MIEQKMEDAIRQNTYTSVTGLSVDGIDTASKACADVAREMFLKFTNWTHDEDAINGRFEKQSDETWHSYHDGNVYSIDNLFDWWCENIYLETLSKGKGE